MERYDLEQLLERINTKKPLGIDVDLLTKLVESHLSLLDKFERVTTCR